MLQLSVIVLTLALLIVVVRRGEHPLEVIGRNHASPMDRSMDTLWWVPRHLWGLIAKRDGGSAIRARRLTLAIGAVVLVAFYPVYVVALSSLGFETWRQSLPFGVGFFLWSVVLEFPDGAARDNKYGSGGLDHAQEHRRIGRRVLLLALADLLLSLINIVLADRALTAMGTATLGLLGVSVAAVSNLLALCATSIIGLIGNPFRDPAVGTAAGNEGA